MNLHLAAIWRHPVKSLGAEKLERITLRTGEALPGDRAYAIAHGESAFDPDAPAWEKCGNFLRIANIPALARPTVGFDPETETLTLTDGYVRATYALATAEGRTALAAWAGEAAGTIRPGPYHVAAAPGVSLSDAPDQAPSIMSLASLRDLSKRVGAALSPRRFRGNLWIDGEGLEPWIENGWAGRRLVIGGAAFDGLEPVERCLATAADPETGQRTANPLSALKALNGGTPLFGILARVTAGGAVTVGDTVHIDLS